MYNHGAATCTCTTLHRYRQHGRTSPLKVNPEVITPRRREEVLRPSPREERRSRPTLKRNVFFFFLQNVLQPLRTMARFDINTRVSRVFLRGYAALLRSPHSSSHSHFFLFRSSVFFTLEKTQPVARIARFQSDDGKVNGYDFDSSWRLSFPIIRITG